MKNSCCSDSQILSILKQAESGIGIAEVCREHSSSNTTLDKWSSNSLLKNIS